MIQRIKNQAGSAILTTLFILMGIVAIGFVGIEIMLSGFSSYMNQEASTQAYFAAEAGMERALSIHKYWLENHDGASFFHDTSKCHTDEWINFTSNDSIDFASVGCTALPSSGEFILPESVNDSIQFKKDEPQYAVKLDLEDYNTGDDRARVVVLKSRGVYLNTAREIEVRFCVPVCNGSASDGCGGVCN